MPATLKLDWTEDKALLGSNLSADSVAGIAGSASRSRLLPGGNLGSKVKNPRGPGTESPPHWGDKVAELLVGHFR